MRGNIFNVLLLGYATGALSKYLSLEEVYGPVSVVDDFVPWGGRMISHSRLAGGNDGMRTRENCTFPIELYIIQDETYGLDAVFKTMKESQLKLMFDYISSAHPGSTFGVGTHRDIPIRTLGDSSDYCWKFRLPLSSDYEGLYKTYSVLDSSGGSDLPENQFGSIVAACQSSTPGWSNARAARLLVVATDDAPHFAGDGSNRPQYNLGEFSGRFDEAFAEEQCISEYYPSPEQVADAIKERGAYVGFLIFGGKSGVVPMSAWEWFNGFIGQPSDFAVKVNAGADDFWQQLSGVISSLEDIECRPAPTTTTPAPTTTTPAPTTTTPAPTTTTPAPITTTPAPITTTPAPITTTPAPTTTTPAPTTTTPAPTTTTPAPTTTTPAPTTTTPAPTTTTPAPATTTPAPTTTTPIPTTTTTTTTTTRAFGTVGWSYDFYTEDAACDCPTDSAAAIKQCTSSLPMTCGYTVVATYSTGGSATTVELGEFKCDDADYRLFNLPRILYGEDVLAGYSGTNIVVEAKDYKVNFTAIDNECEYGVRTFRRAEACSTIRGGYVLENLGSTTAGSGFLEADFSKMRKLAGVIGIKYDTKCSNYENTGAPTASFDYYKHYLTVKPTPIPSTTTTTTTTTTRAPGEVGWSYVFKTEDSGCSCPADSAKVIKECTDALPTYCRYRIEGTYYTAGSPTPLTNLVEASFPGFPFRRIEMPKALDIRGIELIKGYSFENVAVEAENFIVNFTTVPENGCAYSIGLNPFGMGLGDIFTGGPMESYGTVTPVGGVLQADFSEMSRVGEWLYFGYDPSCSKSMTSPRGSFDSYKVIYQVPVGSPYFL